MQIHKSQCPHALQPTRQIALITAEHY